MCRAVGKGSENLPRLIGVTAQRRVRLRHPARPDEQAERFGDLGVVGQRSRRTSVVDEQLPQPLRRGVVVGQRVQHRERVHTLTQVRSRRFARITCRGADVDDVVGELECGADDVAES